MKLKKKKDFPGGLISSTTETAKIYFYLLRVYMDTHTHTHTHADKVCIKVYGSIKKGLQN